MAKEDGKEYTQLIIYRIQFYRSCGLVNELKSRRLQWAGYMSRMESSEMDVKRGKLARNLYLKEREGGGG